MWCEVVRIGMRPSWPCICRVCRRGRVSHALCSTSSIASGSRSSEDADTRRPQPPTRAVDARSTYTTRSSVIPPASRGKWINQSCQEPPVLQMLMASRDVLREDGIAILLSSPSCSVGLPHLCRVAEGHRHRDTGRFFIDLHEVVRDRPSTFHHPRSSVRPAA